MAGFIAEIQVVVLQGERPLAKDNKKLGMFRLDGIPTAPKGGFFHAFFCGWAGSHVLMDADDLV